MKPTSIRLQAAAIAVSALLVGVSAVPAIAGTMQTNQHDLIHKQMGATTPEARSVGAITVGWDTDQTNNVVRGSGVLVGGRFVLTAAHLIDDANGGVFTINGQNYNIVSWVVANRFYGRDDDDVPNPDERLFGSGADLALIVLDRRVGNARNIKAKISGSRKEAGKTATIVGYGVGGSGTLGMNTGGVFGSSSTILNPLPGDGTMGTGTAIDETNPWFYPSTLRAGKNKVEANGPFGPLTKSNRELVTDFDADPSRYEELRNGIEDVVDGIIVPKYDPFTGTYDIDRNDIPISGEYMPAVGDSGGGLFINGRLAGITSWTTRGTSEFFSQAHYTRLSVGWKGWVRNNIKAYNHYLRFPNAIPWGSVEKGGSGFKGVARIYSETEITDDEEVDENDDPIVLVRKGEIINIFGPHLFYDELDNHIAVGSNILNQFIANDIMGADPRPLPEPASLALLSLGGLAMLRRTRR